MEGDKQFAKLGFANVELPCVLKILFYAQTAVSPKFATNGDIAFLKILAFIFTAPESMFFVLFGR